MADLVVDAATLAALTVTVQGSARTVKFETPVARPACGPLGSAKVAAALTASATQQGVRADAVASGLEDVGSMPAATSRALQEHDARLARVF